MPSAVFALALVSALGSGLAMSRSAFAARFTELVGEPVMQYVTRWRMQVAHEALCSESTTVAEQAGRLGYRSEAAMARAFKRVIGASPRAVKRSAGHPPDASLTGIAAVSASR